MVYQVNCTCWRRRSSNVSGERFFLIDPNRRPHLVNRSEEEQFEKVMKNNFSVKKTLTINFIRFQKKDLNKSRFIGQNACITLMRTTSAASAATSVPAAIAMPTSA